MHHRKLSEILEGRTLLHVNSDVTVVDAARRMANGNVAALLIIDDGNLSGIFTERDMLRRVVAVGLDPSKTKIRDVMSQEVMSLDADRLGFEAASLMIENNIRHLAVTGLPGTKYGIVSIRDFALGELTDFEREIDFEKRLWTSL